MKPRFFFLLILPSFVVLISFMIFPMIYSWYLSFHDYNLYTPNRPMVFTGFDNFRQTLSDPIFYSSLSNTLIMMLFGLSIEFIIGFSFASILYSRLKQGRLSSFFRTIFMTPIALAPVVVGWLWRFMYWPKLGLIDLLTEAMGLRSLGWLTDPAIALVSVTIVDIWEWTPFVFLILLSGFQALPEAPLEAAEVEGASKIQKMRYVVLPLMRPVIIIALIFRSIQLVKFFDQVYALTHGGPGFSTYTISYYLYQIGLFRFEIGLASAASQLVNIIVIILVLIMIRMLRAGLQ